MKAKLIWGVSILSLILLFAGLIVIFGAAASVENTVDLSTAVRQAITGGVLCLPYIIIQTYFL